MRTIDSVICDWSARRPAQPAVWGEEGVISYSELWARAGRVARGLKRSGLKPGDRVAWLAKNDVSALELLIGASAAGVVLVPVNWRLAAPEIHAIVADSNAKICFVEDSYVSIVNTLCDQLPNLVEVVALSGAQVRTSYRAWRDMDDGACDRAAAQTAKPADVVLQLYTSGTTGRPKGAMLSHRSLLETKVLWRDLSWCQWRADDVALVAMPMFHIGGMGLALMALEAGAGVRLMREFDAERLLDLADQGAFTRTFLVPAALQTLVRHPRSRRADFRALRSILYGASPMAPTLLEECLAVFGCIFAQQYGMTETCGTVVALTPEDHRRGRPELLGSAGRALPGVEIEIRDAAGRRLPAGAAGQIAIRSVANMTGYWNRPEETAEAIDADGWLLTGDGGILDDDGYLYVQDRLKDMIISGGENIYPTEVENVLAAHPGVAEAAVIGIPDERWGEAVMAFVVRRDRRDVDAPELTAWTAARIARYKLPREIRFVDALPRNASGKILRRVLRESLDGS